MYTPLLQRRRLPVRNCSCLDPAYLRSSLCFLWSHRLQISALKQRQPNENSTHTLPTLQLMVFSWTAMRCSCLLSLKTASRQNITAYYLTICFSLKVRQLSQFILKFNKTITSLNGKKVTPLPPTPPPKKAPFRLRQT